MLTEQILPAQFTNMNPETKTVSVTIITVVLKDGSEIARSSNTRAFAPGDIEAVKAYIGLNESPEITYLETIWSQEAIDAWLNLQE